MARILHDLYRHPSKANASVINEQHGDQNQAGKLPILREEVAAAVRQLKNGKSAGIDNIPGELIRNGDQHAISILLNICNEIWLSGKWPQSWVNSMIVPIPKKGDLKECRNYRTISLICHNSNVILRIILNRLQPQIKPLLADEQARLYQAEEQSSKSLI